MPSLTAKFSAEDKISDRIADIAQAGMSMVEQFEKAGDVASAALDGVERGASAAVSSVDGVATSIADMADQTDHWTAAIGSYDKSMMEATFSTQELVEMGYKTADALEEQNQMLAVCEQSASELGKSMEAATGIQDELCAVMETASATVAEMAKNEDISAETKAALTKASEEAAEAMNGLVAAQEEAAAALEKYNDVIASGTTDLGTLESAAERAGHAAEALAEANGRVSNATEELAKATEKASEEVEKSGTSGVTAIDGIAGALAAAGLTAKVQEIAGAVYDLTTAFSEAESTVVKATGASGEALDGLNKSMMNAYATSKSGDLGTTAAAIGEINTRMALTGDVLTDVTGQFLDFSEITGSNVVGSVQNATKIMNKWDIEAGNVGSVLDKLAYAGQISGISVDTLSSTVTNSSATFQALNMNLDNAIGLLADLELYGTSSQVTVTGLRTAVNNFARDGLDAGDALRNVIDKIANMEDVSAATALAVETFGSRAGQELAGAIRSGAISVDSLTQSLEVANGTVANTAATAQTLDQQWTQASNNISTAFTTAIQPSVNGISSGLAGIANGFGTFLNKHPAIAKGIAVIGVGIGTVAAGIAGVSSALGIYTAVTTIAKAVTAAFGTTFAAAFLPVTAIIAGVAALATAVYFLIDALKPAAEETEAMTAVTRAQYYELQDLNAEYEEACKKYGETSEEALKLKYQVDDLSDTFEANRQTVEDFTAEVNALCESASQISDAFDSSIASIHTQEVGTLALIQKYEDLTTQTDLTEAQAMQLEAITTKLAQSYPDLAGQLDNATGSTTNYAEALRRACEQEAEGARQQKARETYVEALQKQAELTEEIAKAQENVVLEQAKMDEMSGIAHIFTRGEWDDLRAYENMLNELQAAEAENNALIAEIEQKWAGVAEAEDEATENIVIYQEAVATAYNGVREKIEALCAAYDEAYQAALESFEGQFGLFDAAQADMDATVSNAQAALNSQLAYWENYNANLEALTVYGESLTGAARDNYGALLAYVQNGSEEAAGLAGSIADAIASGDEQAIESLAQTISDVSAQQKAAAATTADWVTDFSAQMDEIEQEMLETVEGMNLSDEAAASATSTITAYADQIRAGKSGAVDAANEVARAVSEALANAGTSVSVSTAARAPAHANGTTNAESAFIAGENGPELVVARKANAYATGTAHSSNFYIAGEDGPELIIGEQGSTVFPTQETDRLIDALNTKQRPLQVLSGNSAEPPGTSSNNVSGLSEQIKRIFLDIGGSGAIEVGGNVDKETILDILMENIKPVLMGIIQSEIYEEGKFAYDF